MRGKHDKEKPNLVPGPGYYKPDEQLTVIRLKDPSWK